MPDVLLTCVNAFAVVGLEQGFGRPGLQHRCKFPAQVVDILDAAIAAACSKGAHNMRAVADEQHTSVHESLEPCTLERIDRAPFELELYVGTDGVAHTLHDPRRLALGLRVRVPAELKIDTEDLVGLTVNEHALGRIETRLEPEAAIARVVGPHAHVGDQELLLEDVAFELEAQSAAHGAARAVGREHPHSLKLIPTIRRVDFEQHAALRLAQPYELVLPTYLDQIRELRSP